MPTWCRWIQLKNSSSQPHGQASARGHLKVVKLLLKVLWQKVTTGTEKPFIFVSLQQRACFWVYEGYITKNASEVFVKETLLEMFCLFVSGLILTPKVDQRFMKSKCSQDEFSHTSFFMIGELGFFSNNQAPDTHISIHVCVMFVFPKLLWFIWRTRLNCCFTG